MKRPRARQGLVSGARLCDACSRYVSQGVRGLLSSTQYLPVCLLHRADRLQPATRQHAAGSRAHGGRCTYPVHMSRHLTCAACHVTRHRLVSHHGSDITGRTPRTRPVDHSPTRTGGLSPRGRAGRPRLRLRLRCGRGRLAVSGESDRTHIPVCPCICGMSRNSWILTRCNEPP